MLAEIVGNAPPSNVTLLADSPRLARKPAAIMRTEGGQCCCTQMSNRGMAMPFSTTKASAPFRRAHTFHRVRRDSCTIFQACGTLTLITTQSISYVRRRAPASLHSGSGRFTSTVHQQGPCAEANPVAGPARLNTSSCGGGCGSSSSITNKHTDATKNSKSFSKGAFTFSLQNHQTFDLELSFLSIHEHLLQAHTLEL